MTNTKNLKSNHLHTTIAVLGLKRNIQFIIIFQTFTAKYDERENVTLTFSEINHPLHMILLSFDHQYLQHMHCLHLLRMWHTQIPV